MRPEALYIGRLPQQDTGYDSDLSASGETGEEPRDRYRMHLLDPLYEYVFNGKEIGKVEEKIALGHLAEVIHAAHNVIVKKMDGRADEKVMASLMRRIYGGTDPKKIDERTKRFGLARLIDWDFAFKNRHEAKMFNDEREVAMVKFLSFIDHGRGEEYLDFIGAKPTPKTP